MSKPIDVVHIRDENLLAITWDDGKFSRLPIWYLRGWCSCAACQGHQQRVVYHPADESTHLAEMWEVGAYALGMRFSDGHDTGIYRWAWLRILSPEIAPRGLKLGGHFFNERYYPDLEVSR